MHFEITICLHVLAKLIFFQMLKIRKKYYYFVVVPPHLLKGNINALKFKKLLEGSALQHAPPKYPAALKRLAPFSNRPIPPKRVRAYSDSNDDLRNRLDRKISKSYSVLIENLPEKLNGDRDLVKLLASGFGIVEGIEFDLEDKRCEIVFKDKDMADNFYFSKNEQTYDGVILKCHPPVLLG